EKYLVMQTVADKLCVSRVTILNDFETVKEELKEAGAKMISDAGKGVCVRCSRRIRMKLLVGLLRQLMLDVEDEGFFQRFVLQQLDVKYTFNEICSHEQEYLRINNLVFVADTLYDTVLFLFAAFNLMAGKRQEDAERCTDYEESDQLMKYVGYKLDCQVSGAMLNGFREYIQDEGISLYIKKLDEVEFYEIIMHFLSNIDLELQTNLSQDDILIDSLLLHIKNMRDWGSLGFEISELDEMAFDYQRVLEVMDKNLYVLEKYLSYKVNENMKKSIMIHICVAIIRNNKKVRKPSVVIVCPGSMATGRYLEAQVESYFDFNIKGLYPVSRVSRQLEELKDVDFFISTVELHHPEIKCLKVHAVLTMKDMKMIQKAAFDYQKRQELPRRSEKKRAKKQEFQTMLREQKLPENVYQEIETLISGYQAKEQEKTAIGELMERENILFDESVTDWETGIRKAAAVLVEKGNIGSGFVEKAIQNIRDYGDYIILGSGVALAHAGKDYEVYKDSLSVLVSHAGIAFSEKENRVYFLFCFSSRGENEHIELFHEIVEIGQNEKLRNELLQMNEEELYQALCLKDSQDE
ncbi:MAG: BglG family transcription antiterminator, partial [Dorea sp.]